jgi:hypothetical protein
VAALTVRRDGGNPGLSNHNSEPAAMHLIMTRMRQLAYPQRAWQRRIYAMSPQLG